VLGITAQEASIQMFLAARLESKRFNKTLTARIIDAISPDAQGR